MGGLGERPGLAEHAGIDGAMLGIPGMEYHLEFTQEHGHPAGRAPTEDNLLVFYLPDDAEWREACERMAAAGFVAVPSHNPYWDERGRTFEDPDGYRVVLENSPWPKY